MSLLTRNNVLHHCRTCLTYLEPSEEDESQVLRYHLKTTENLADWIENLEKFLSLRMLATSDDYPQFVCGGCFKKLKEFNEFQLLAWQTAEKLSAILENLQIEFSEQINILRTNNISELQTEKIDELVIAKEEEFLSLTVKLEKQPVEPLETTASDNTNLNVFTSQSHCGANSVVNVKEDLETCTVYEEIINIRNPKEAEQISKNIKKHDCDQCGYSFSHHSILNAHKRQIHNQTVPEHLLRNRPLKNTNAKNIVKEKDALQCDICNKVFKSEKRFMTHISSSHEKLRKFACQFCHLRFTTRQNLTGHKTVHTGEKPFPCEVCNRRFSRLGLMKQHRKTHDRNLKDNPCANLKIATKKPRKKTLQNEIQNTNLDETFESETQFGTGKEAEIKMEFECTDTNAFDVQTSICDMSNNDLSNFSIGDTIADDQNLTEADDFSEKTKKSEKSNSYLKKPEVHKDCGAISKCEYKCDQCGLTFPHKVSVTAHKRQVHNQAKSKRLNKLKLLENTNKMSLTTPIESFETCKASGKEIHRCNICQREFNFISRLKAHILLKHKGLRPFACQQCDLSFKTKNQLLTHERIHTGEKPFTCNICERSFTQLANLYQHRKYIHEYQFACNCCNRRFAKKSQLQIHEYIHTGEKAFTCHICDRSFTQLSNLYKHQKYTHKLVKTSEINA